MAERNPGLLGGNTLKLGIFGANCSSGRTYVTIPERWDASWENNLTLARMADDVGIECMVPIARWKGYGGESNPNGSSFEATTWACGLLASTKRINVFSTIHVPLVNPVWAAKQMATIDHVGQGRFGVNLVCGWSEDEFGMFGIPKNEHDDGYAQAEEWWTIVSRLWAGDDPFDYDGRFYQLRGVEGRPAPYGDQAPIMMNAGMSEVGRAFAIRNSGMHFDGIQSPERIADTKRQATERGRQIQVWTPVGIACRPSRREADEFVEYCVAHADLDAIDKVRGGKNLPLVQRVMARGGYCAVGDPDAVAERLAWVQSLGLDGVVLHFVNYLDEFPYFAQEVLPRLERMQLRRTIAELAR